MVIKKLIILFFIIIASNSCGTVKYVTVPLTTPPEMYYPATNIFTQKQLINEYKNSLMKIAEWQTWYKIQTNNSNTNK